MRRTPLTRLCLAVVATLGLTVAAGPDTATADRRDPQVRADRGTWGVDSSGDRAFEISWTSPHRLPVTDARPEIVRNGSPLGQTTVARNGRTVSVRVTSVLPPSAADLDVVLSGRVLDEPAPAAEQPSPRAQYTAPRQFPALDVDPGVPGDYRVTSGDYRLPGFKAAGMPRPVEMVGHVVRPADGQLTAAAPLVLFLHGRHEYCYDPAGTGRPTYKWPCRNGTRPIPSQLGYDYVQRLLASQGYITVSVAANGINAQDDRVADGGAEARAQLVRRHLEQWATWAQDGTYQADLQNVVLVGHSRGGEGVNRASLETPLGSAYRIVGQVLLAPTNFARQTAAYVPTVTMLSYCDGDVIDLQGQAYTDLARDLTRDDTSLKSSVLVMGANHNYFNTEWTPGLSKAPSFDDFGGPANQTCGKKTPSRLSAAEQRKVGRAYIAGAVHLETGTDPDTLAMFVGTRARVPSAGDAVVRSQAIGGGRVLRRPGLDADLAPAVGAVTRVCAGRVDTSRKDACGRASTQVKTPHWIPGKPPGIPSAPAFEMQWKAAHQRGGLTFRDPLDASTASALDLRTIVDPKQGGVRVDVRLVDAGGHTTTVTPVNGGWLPALPRGRQFFLGKLMAQTIRVPMSRVGGIDVHHLAEIDLVATSRNGHVWVLDVAAVPTGPPAAVPAKRLVQVSLGNLRQVEGNAARTSTARVPFRLSAPATGPGRFVVTVENPFGRGTIAAQRVDVAPGQTSGTVSFLYRANRIDDLNRSYVLTAYPLRNLMTRDSYGRVTIVDDDSRPTLTVRRTPKRQVEGRPITWTFRLSKPVGYDSFVEGLAVAGRSTTGPRLTLGDLPRKFVKRQGLGGVDPRTSLRRAGVWLYTLVPAGETVGRLRLPTRRDAVSEPAESVTMRIRARHFGTNRLATGYLRDAG